MTIIDRRHGGSKAGRLHLTATTTLPGQVITLARLTVSVPTSIAWGDGSYSLLPANSTVAVTHTYTSAGVYNIVLDNARNVTQLKLDSATLGNLNTSELRYSVITYFWISLITNSTIKSVDMTNWRPTTCGLYLMPAGTYNIASVDMVNWRPTTWYLVSMPAGTYNIASANMVDWRPTTWQFYSMPAGTYNIASADMVDWRPTTWGLVSMQAGTYNIASADMVDWRPTTWGLYSMPAGTYSFAASCMRNWTGLSTLKANDLALDAATVDTILTDLYAGRAGFTAAAPTANLGGTNADPTGIYQPVVPPTSGLETKFDLVNDPAAEGFHKWAIST